MAIDISRERKKTRFDLNGSSEDTYIFNIILYHFRVCIYNEPKFSIFIFVLFFFLLCFIRQFAFYVFSFYLCDVLQFIFVLVFFLSFLQNKKIWKCIYNFIVIIFVCDFSFFSFFVISIFFLFIHSNIIIEFLIIRDFFFFFLFFFIFNSSCVFVLFVFFLQFRFINLIYL